MIAIASADHVRGSETRPVVRHHGCPKRITITVLNPGNYVAFDICNGSRHKNGSTIDRRRPSSVRRSEVPRRDHGDCRFSSRRGFWDAPFAVLDCNLDNVRCAYAMQNMLNVNISVMNDVFSTTNVCIPLSIMLALKFAW
jgi:hypothetical protein